MRPSGEMVIADDPDDVNSRTQLARSPRRARSSRSVILLVVVTASLALTLGILIGRYAISRDKDGLYLPGAPARLMEDEDPDISQKIHDAMSPENIEDNLIQLTKKPHIAGRDADLELVELIKTRFESSGLEVRVTPYDILLSYPDDNVPNTIRLLDADNNVLYDAANDESDLSFRPGAVRAFHGFSPAGLVEGQLIFAGYGRVEDFDWLLSKGINVSGHLVIVKYGKMFRGDKVDIAQSYGAAGVIMYTDPAEYTGMNDGDYRVYPETWWLPPDGAQRGTVFTGGGDPLTPGYPATDLAYRLSEDEAVLPKIPSHPIGYGAAEKIMRYLSGMEEVPSDWLGGMNISYNSTGPGFTNTTWRLQLNVTSHNQRAMTHNVFGIIKGEVEPDRYVLLGNHRDAWIYGALDPSTGTAAMLEVARVMGELVKSGEWKPRRTIIFCSWGAEEYGLIGSTEWVEQYVATLRERAVAYINMDTAVLGNDTLNVDATPLMHNIAYEAAKKVKNPNPSEIAKGRSSVYDTWLHHERLEGRNKPKIGNLASGSDYAPLLQKAGVTALDMFYNFRKDLYNVQWYAVYHTEYEVFDIYKNQFDRDFEYLTAVGRFSAELVRALADSFLLPMSLKDYGTTLSDILGVLKKDYGTKLESKLDNFGQLEETINEFKTEVENFEERKSNMDIKNPYIARQINDQMMLLERAFLQPEGLPTRPLKKHLIWAENANDAYAGSSFPGLVDLLFKIDEAPDTEGRWERVKLHFAAILHIIQAAGASLREVNNFMPA